MSQTTQCEEVRRQMSLYLDGEMSAAQRAGYEVHLASCQPCRIELSGLRAMLAELRTLPEVRTPDLVPGVRRKLAARTTPGTAADWAAWFRELLNSAALRPVALAATAILVIVVVASLPSSVRMKGGIRDDAQAPAPGFMATPATSVAEPPASQPADRLATLAEDKLLKDKKREAAPRQEARYDEAAMSRKLDERDLELNQDAVSLRQALDHNKTAAMEEAIEGALSARGRVGVRRFDPAKEQDLQLPEQERAKQVAAASGNDLVAGAVFGNQNTSPVAIVGGAAGGLGQKTFGTDAVGALSRAQATKPAMPAPAPLRSAQTKANEDATIRYQWDVPDFDNAAQSLQQWVNGNFGMVVAVDHRTFLVTLPPVLLPEFSRRFSSRLVSAGGKAADGTQSESQTRSGFDTDTAPASDEPFITVWIELIRSQ